MLVCVAACVCGCMCVWLREWTAVSFHWLLCVLVTVQKLADVENVTQVMWPSEYFKDLLHSVAYARALYLSQWLQGSDMVCVSA
jgi:hypothetical protein